MAKEKVVLITGASSGIGEASAKTLVNNGHKVILTARSEDKLAELVESLGEDNALSVPADATDFTELENVVTKGLKKFGRLDAAFANAGMGVSTAGTEKGDPDEWSTMIDINIKALLWTAKATLPHLRQNKGHFILTSSAAGRKPIKGSIYGATKWFAYGFGQNLAEEMSEWNGRCTTIAPGMVNTPFFDEAKPDKLDPQDVADAVLFAIEANQRNNVREIYLMPTN
ncbi:MULTISPECIES: SDR family oxidoreductase [Pseudoalteromonas]|jgi:NADP-dependent 3-hydroxy acid dehydrogenase YdfG|uniref:SDR family oxidoreductase n=3 Tax=Gammaproteobacteria TaxID=1236 RepID=A0AAD0U6P9_9GAMM|nr:MULTISPECIES: SDR family oxidoreductase [Pseudoalteromonas]MDC9520306.1 SDR family oxidoreductase [Pseudoalteromonas sp. Angola-31]AYM88319.1 SDR family oxidoreductase [Pseudoalteromonas agarivorans]AZN34817.1 SDR family oxidoreductase [Pseudoalteromonas sp. Xi13]ENN99520.1 oxidoreductase NAD(P)-binding subunit [Pseudoalteromonas agarivorans S816]ETJ48031.1 short-chain dehydrogenase [Pseudoalteromonas agarivorans]|tara:strand:+ start:5787 stop:6467 length:681 start_codon:yes stop_codon:yes gene_type:complete